MEEKSKTLQECLVLIQPWSHWGNAFISYKDWIIERILLIKRRFKF